MSTASPPRAVPGPRAGRWVIPFLTGVLALILVVQAGQAVAAFAANADRWLPYPYPRPGSEGLMLYETVLMRAGGDLYGPITPDHFISGPYPPVYYWLAGQVMPATPGFQEGRTLSLWAALLTAALAALIVWGDSKTQPATRLHISRFTFHVSRFTPLLAGLLAAGLWLACPPVLIWSTRFRADMLMIAFQTAGLACLVYGVRSAECGVRNSDDQEKPDTQHATRNTQQKATPHSALRTPHSVFVWLAIPCFVLALYTKQTALAGPLGAAAYLLLADWRRGLAWIAGLGALGGGIFVALDLASGHGFYGKMVVYHSLPWSASTFTRLLTAWAEDHWPLIGIALGYLVICLATRRNSPLAWYVAATFLTLPTAGVVGADHNHLLSIDLALVLAAGALIRGPWSVVRDPKQENTQHATDFTFHVSRFTFHLSRFTALAASSAFLALASTPSDWYGPDFAMLDDDQQTQMHKIIEMIRAAPPGTYFADDPGVLALAGKATDYDDPFTVTALAASGRWDASVFENQLRTGYFPLVILAGEVGDRPGVPLRSDILTPAMRAALLTGYRELYRDVLFTYVPK